jgi:dTDP-4-dehydrorhamnose reductase
VYHVSSEPINKFDLLALVAKVYGKDILIRENSTFTIDRSLDSLRFRLATGYQPPDWESLIKSMKNFYDR